MAEKFKTPLFEEHSSFPEAFRFRSRAKEASVPTLLGEGCFFGLQEGSR
jgi:hypothetical protein